MKYLLAISIGPVQDFIAAARKTADLYAGSQLLQEVVAAAAATFNDTERIFPANIGGGGANKILAQIEGNAKQRAQDAQDAAQNRLSELSQKYLAPLQDYINLERANSQVENFLEVYTAWVPCTDATYLEDRKKVEGLLAARKALRDFKTFDQFDIGVPKSPFDPAFATVFRLEIEQYRKNFIKFQEKYNFKSSEVLDAISLIKRLYGREKSKTGLDVLDTHILAHRAKFPDTVNWDEEDRKPDYAYYAILVADGDNMGAYLSKCDSVDKHMEFSKRLDKFAGEAKKIVKRKGGFCVYAGGDDVLALIPVTTVLECGKELSEAFQHGVRGTLSAGIAIVHYREPLSTSLAYARDAEKSAKKVSGKGAVSVALHTRGGAPLSLSMKWEASSQLQNSLDAAKENRLPRGLPYELRELAREWSKDFDMSALTCEAKRIANRKRNQEGEKVGVSIPDFDELKDLEEFANLLIIARFLSGMERGV